MKLFKVTRHAINASTLADWGNKEAKLLVGGYV